MGAVSTYARIKDEAVSLREELDRLEQRALRFERLKGEADTLRREIARLGAQPIATKPLEQILALAGEVPEGAFITSGGFAWPGGHDVRYVLLKVAGDALADAERQRQETAASLERAKQRLVQIEAALKEFS